LQNSECGLRIDRLIRREETGQKDDSGIKID